METRANHVWVGTVTLLLVVLMVGFVVWVARLGESDRAYYDIFFRQSVDGLGKGTDVSYSGVPAGQVTQIELWKDDPGVVRVRIALDPKVPILQGTTAAIQGSFTGISAIQLSGGAKGAAPISAPGPDGVPVIPTSRSGLGALLSSAPVLMEKITSVADQLALLLSDENIGRMSSILANTNRASKNLADASPQMKITLVQLQATLRQANGALAEFQAAAANANKDLDPAAPGIAHQLTATLKSAQASADALQAELTAVRPATQQLSQSTLPQAEATLRDLRATTQALRAMTQKIDDGGAGAVLGSPKLPEYKP